jgi:hypothetical protein
MVRAKQDLRRTFGLAVLATFACAWHCAPYDWILLAIPAWLLLPRASPSPLAKRALVGLFLFGWTIVNLVDAEEAAWGFALHPAMPMLCGWYFWLMKRT